MMQQESRKKKSKQSDKLMLSAQDFLASLSALLEQEEASKIQMELSFFEIARFASMLKPKYLFLENVKGLISHDKGYTFETIIGSLDELGYDVEWQVLNSKDFGVPQNRERCYIVGHLRGQRTRNVFPISGSRSDKSIIQLGNIKKTESFGGNPQCGRVYSPAGLAPCLNTMQGGQREPKIFIDGNVRKLTPRECWRL